MLIADTSELESPITVVKIKATVINVVDDITLKLLQVLAALPLELVLMN